MLDAAIIVNLYSEHKSQDDTSILVFIASYMFHMPDISGIGILTTDMPKKIYVSIFYTNDLAAQSKKEKRKAIVHNEQYKQGISCVIK
jgi:hypothetical protein